MSPSHSRSVRPPVNQPTLPALVPSIRTPQHSLSLIPSDLEPDNKIVGQIILNSPLPDPVKSNYANCLYTAEIYVTRIESGKLIRRSISVALPGFVKRSHTREAKFKIGDLIRMTLGKAESMPKSVKTIQRSDTLENYQLDFYYVLSTEKLKKPQPI